MAAVVEIKNVSKIYGEGLSEVRALDDVDLTIEENEFVAIVGPSGSGKSTMMNLIGCLDKPTRGIVKIAGQDVNELNDVKLTQLRNYAIGFVFQQFFLLPKTTAVDNVSTPLLYRGLSSKEAKEKSLAMLAKLGLADRSDHQPTQLSGGQQQRVAIARALVTDPTIILADEPTGALDSQSGEQVMNLMEALHKEGKTIILITHEAEVANRAHRRITLKDGKIVSDDRSGQKV
ncbi:MAG: ABC transporter ATP-binding protein [Candidatus Nanopelagicales bacterium]